MPFRAHLESQHLHRLGFESAAGGCGPKACQCLNSGRVFDPACPLQSMLSILRGRNLQTVYIICFRAWNFTRPISGRAHRLFDNRHLHFCSINGPRSFSSFTTQHSSAQVLQSAIPASACDRFHLCASPRQRVQPPSAWWLLQVESSGTR